MKRTFFILIIILISSFNIFGQDKKDTPRNGEGLDAFLKRNHCTDTECYERFLELNKKKLGKSKVLKKGVSYVLPSAIKTKPKKDLPSIPRENELGLAKKKSKIFGSKYEEYTIKSDKLKGACFFLSSGHGGPDPGSIGKVGNTELHEDEYAYDITLRLARSLLEEGATVHIIIQDSLDGIRDDMFLKNSKRETCMGKSIPLNQLKRLKQRSDKINALNNKAKEKYKRSVFIHLDSRSVNQRLDVFFYYAPKSVAGKSLANTMKGTFSDLYDKHQPNRGFSGTISERNLYVLSQTSPVGIYAELGNIQNSFDQRRFVQYDNRQAIANWMCKGLITDYENSKNKK